MSLGAQAHDVINGVKAAHDAVADLSPRWVVDGHSQGGGTAWFVAQQEAVLGDPNYLGMSMRAPLRASYCAGRRLTRSRHVHRRRPTVGVEQARCPRGCYTSAGLLLDRG
jgi:hypothetical protein